MTIGFERAGALPDDGGDPYEQWDAAYVLGSLSSTERREYENHLNTCRRCRDAVSELSGMPALLALFGRDEMAAMSDDEGWPAEPPPMRPEVLTALLAKVSWRRRRARWLTIAVSTVAAAVLALGVFVALRPGPAAPELPPQASAAVTLTPVADSSLDATVTLSSRGWGTHIEMTCTYYETVGEPEEPGDGDKLAMVAVGRDGTHTQLATWMAKAGDTAFPSGSTFMPVDQIVAVQVVSADTGDLLLQRNL
jgi:hypothetical protein